MRFLSAERQIPFFELKIRIRLRFRPQYPSVTDWKLFPRNAFENEIYFNTLFNFENSKSLRRSFSKIKSLSGQIKKKREKKGEKIRYERNNVNAAAAKMAINFNWNRSSWH